MRISDWSSDVCASDLATCCSHSGVSTTCEKKAPKPSEMASVEKLNPRNRKTRRSTTGLASVSSQMTKATKLTAATIARPTIQVDPNQSCSRPVSSMIWKAPTDTTSRRSEEHTSELQSLIRTPYAVICLKQKKTT